jgi:TonB family protein
MPVRTLAALLVLPVMVGAQQGSASAPTCKPPNTSDSTVVTAFGRLTTFLPAQERQVPVWYEEVFLQEVARRLRLPDPFLLSTYALLDSIPSMGTGRHRGYPTANATLAIRVAETNTTPALLTSSAVPAFDKALIEAVRATSRDSAVPPLPEELQKKSVDFRLRITMADRPQVGIPMFRARVPVAEFSKLVQPKPGNIAPRYPDELRQKNIEGSVRVQFVVDESGSALEGTILILNADHLLFAKAVLDFLEKARFEPATIGGCPVAQVVEQPFTFTLWR